MAAFSCPYCKNTLSPAAAACPKCGQPTAGAARKAPAKIKRWQLVLGGVFVLFVLGNFLGTKDKKPAATPQTETSSTDVAKVDPCANISSIEDWNKASILWQKKNKNCKPDKDKNNYQAISASVILNEFENNEVAANRKYKGKRVAISGEIYSIDQSFLGYPELVFGANDGFRIVRCQFPKSEADRIAHISKGQHVTAIGTVQAFTLGIQLSIEDCMFPTKK